MGRVLNIYQSPTVFLTLGIELKDSPCFEGAHHLLGEQDKQTDGYETGNTGHTVWGKWNSEKGL